MYEIWNIILLVLGTLVSLFIVSLGDERLTEGLKLIMEFLAKIGKNFTWLANAITSPVFKWLASLFVAWAVISGFDLNFLLNLEFFKDLDPTLIQLLNTVLTWVISNYLHTKLLLPKANDVVRRSNAVG